MDLDAPAPILRAALEALLGQQRRGNELLARLTQRETQVVMAIARGETPSATGAQLQLNVKTVSTYRARALKKLGLQSNAQLAVLCFQAGRIAGVVP